MRKFKVFFKLTEDGEMLDETVKALNHIDAEQKIAAKHNLPFNRIVMSKDVKLGKLHAP